MNLLQFSLIMIEDGLYVITYSLDKSTLLYMYCISGRVVTPSLPPSLPPSSLLPLSHCPTPAPASRQQCVVQQVERVVEGEGEERAGSGSF